MMCHAKYAGWVIIGVEDSRSKDEHGHVIPFSGEQRPCDCCGRAIDVLVTIAPARHSSRWRNGRIEPVMELGNQSAIVGMTCAKSLGLRDATKMRVRFETSSYSF